ncbi:hypothetical protein [Streptomyces nodosus]|uniref:Uncharacterized protein n=1 Tax=Streptomyces nodosus TaxID=40318 RepID=A0A0B5DC33_9ACTN|nr:hypothetical protein [Streptomyces nodosus]AJE41148.1 hypothetical protein SNOD_14715 [Streptomyces nodosus]MBB4792289.1 hypothetical protein [Streptomyces nodosus]QEV39692.1 hypothetical protein CP978_15035 [Streptomyces nodosus]
MRITDPEYPTAVEAAVEILRERARRGQTITYGELSAELATQGFDSIPPHRGVMTYLLKDVCLHRNEDGRAPMLSAIVVNKASREPSDQFSGLARSLPFARPANWTWRDEQQQVFAQHREQ